jgi:hypothetical protein
MKRKRLSAPVSDPALDAMRLKAKWSTSMSGLEWMLSWALFMIYISCLFTVCRLTFQKGYTVLGIVGIFLPLLWLIGAMLPPKQGSSYWVSQGIAHQAQMEQYTR